MADFFGLVVSRWNEGLFGQLVVVVFVLALFFSVVLSCRIIIDGVHSRRGEMRRKSHQQQPERHLSSESDGIFCPMDRSEMVKDQKADWYQCPHCRRHLIDDDELSDYIAQSLGIQPTSPMNNGVQ